MKGDGQLSVTGERIHVHFVPANHLGSLPMNSVVRLTDGSPYVPQVPGYLKTNIIIMKGDAIAQWLAC